MCKQHTALNALKSEKSLSEPTENKNDVVETATATKDTVNSPTSVGESDALAAVNQSLSALHALFEEQVTLFLSNKCRKPYSL